MPAPLECANGTSDSTGLLAERWKNGATHDEDTQSTASCSFAKLEPSSQRSPSSSSTLPVLPPGSLYVRTTLAAGRGVFAAVDLPAGTLVEVSHVLLFPAKEYHEHGRYTQLDDYTYVWSKGAEGKTMALALGIGE